MFTKKTKKGVSLFELLGAVALSGVVAMLLSAVVLFVSRGSKIITENSNTTLDSSKCSVLILNKINSITVNDASTGTFNANAEAKFFSTKKYIIDDNGDFKLITPDDDKWTGPKEISFKIDTTTNSLCYSETDKDGNVVNSNFEFYNSTIVAESSYIKIAEASTYTYLFEVKIDYKTKSSSTQTKTYYSSIYVNKVK